MKRFACALGALSLIFLIAACGGSTGPDARAPRAVTDLQAVAVTESTVTLTWTAPGDDGGNGTAAAYDLRLATAPITIVSFAQATPVEDAPAPQPADSTEVYEVRVLSAASGNLAGPQDVNYYFALRTRDDAENWSGISNVASSELLDSTPPAAIDDLAVEAVNDSTLRLTWTTPGDDNFAGVATAYDVRYSQGALDLSSWGQATVAPDPPTPGQVYTQATMEITALEPGVTYFVGVRAVDERGNTAALSNIASGAPFADAPVDIPDPGLLAALRAELGIPTGPIYASDLAGLQTLVRDGHGIADLTGLEFCFNLEVLALRGNAIMSLEPLAGLTALRDLYLSDNAIEDISSIAGLVNLETLFVDRNALAVLPGNPAWPRLRSLIALRNELSDVAGIAGLPALRFLDLRENQLFELPDLSALTQLAECYLAENALTGLAPLAGATALSTLDISDNLVSDLSPLSGLPLDILRADRNQLTDLEGLEGATVLTSLRAVDNEITDISAVTGLHLRSVNLNGNAVVDLQPLSSSTGMLSLSLEDNAVEDLSPVMSLTQLSALNVEGNAVSTLDPLADLINLRTLNFSRTAVESLTVVANLENLETLAAEETAVVDLTPLAELPDLDLVILSGTPVVDLAPLVENTALGLQNELYLIDCDQLSTVSLEEHIPALEARGVVVHR